MRTTSLIVICVVGFIVYTAIVGPLRRVFDDRWPYINVFLASPGRAASTVAIATGLFIALRRYSNTSTYRYAAIGLSLLLVSGLMNSLYSAWATDNRTELQKIVFEVPWRMFVWKWYWFVDVPNVVAAVGFLFLVVARVTHSPKHKAA